MLAGQVRVICTHCANSLNGVHHRRARATAIPLRPLPYQAQESKRFALCRQSQSRRRQKIASATWLDDTIVDPGLVNPDPTLINEDFRPVRPRDRTFGTFDLAALWIGLVVSNTTWYLAGGLVEMGFSWWQGILTVVLGNLITLVPLVLNAHPGTKYGIPFPVAARASFGVRGAMLPALMRALVACGWFGIMTWVGSTAVHELLCRLVGPLSTSRLPWLGISLSQAGCFAAFWAFQVAIIVQGMGALRTVERWCAPILIAFSAALLVWAFNMTGGSFGTMLSAPGQFGPGMAKHGQFWGAFWPALTANVGYWATLSINVADFSRHAKSQRAQVLGQALGLPLCMAAFTFTGLAVTSATPAIFGRIVSDPVELLSCLKHPLGVACGLVGLVLASLSTNIAANIVAPANALVNINPANISFRSAALLTCVLGATIRPWKLITSTQGFIFTWLIGYSALLGPVAGILIADYYLCRHRELDINALYSCSPTGRYWYQGGWNVAAIISLALGSLPSIPGFLHTVHVLHSIPPMFEVLYQLTWFVGFAVALVCYYVLMILSQTQGSSAQYQLP